jgi:diguanylate cyclase (GGDEF)-like protein
MVENDIVRQTFEVFLLIGVTAAANPLYSPNRTVYVAFLLSAFLPFTIWLMLQGGIFIILGCLAIIYMLIMGIISFYSNNLLTKSLYLRFENISLVDNLSNAKNTLELRTQELELSLSLVQATLESTTDGILVVNLEKKVESFNKKFIEMWKIPKQLTEENDDDKLIAYVLDQLVDPVEFVNKVEKLYASKIIESFDEILFKDGRIFERYSKPQMIGNKCVGRVWSFRDVTGRKLLEAELYNQANFDLLTGLPNRVLVRDRLSQAILYAERSKLQVAVLFLDLDRFKAINDTLGHMHGDKLLGLAAKRLSECVRVNDTVSRVGGDEFLIILTLMNEEKNTIEIARKCLKALNEPFLIQGHKFSISVSIGISFYPRDGIDAETLIRNADIAMYHAKELGRNNFQYFTQEMNEKVQARLKVENYLRNALTQNELYVLYQPIVNLTTMRIVGAEALMRWNHPQLGSILPTDFISVAEESGMIVSMGEWILKIACQQMSEWRKQKLDILYVSVNLSARQFKQANLHEKIQIILKETELNPGSLAVELTESVIMDDIEENIKSLNKMKKMGIMIAIDDFGIGYSSLNYLKKLPVDKLKIDISFIKDIMLSVDGAAITAAIIALANKLNLEVIAEGVEDQEQLNFLIKHECDEVQGFYFSEPLDKEAFTQLLIENPKIKPPTV